jgi:gluconate 5-dehydrogenase
LQGFSLEGKLALITGSSGGIGLALARGMAQAGAAIVLNGRDAGKLATVAAQLRAEGHTIHESSFDATVNDVKAAVQKIESEIGAIDILVNNAGIQRRNPLEEFKESDWHDLINTNLNSVFYAAQAVAPHDPARRGKIINICSVQSELGVPASPPIPPPRAR